ncbi:LysM peptidoglycan-binding domain-containing protein [Larkinella terrae]|uniref:LysM peptidoglycan-binding domain-containing protein n=1 Tax=Larkinella terrae TaxID=2025311 RepID=A0A7K0EJE8_9BACT|nr:LysM peptidoglycan-binding domain-containing protein [Larkinella terrae]MRS61862.1 LysM peptidoglycan-binding domain-containing protein [Larkinella terrae]
MKRLMPLLFAGWLTSIVTQAHPFRLDSLGMEKKDGKLFVLHRVEQGQTLYSLVRRYNTTVQAIKDANPGMSENFRYDQVVRVPASNLSRKEEKAVTKAIKKEEKELLKQEEREVKQETVKEANSGIHQVEPGQTLYSLAARYGVSMDEVRKWNNLSSDHIVSGQPLIVSEKAWRVREPLAKPAIAPAHRSDSSAESSRTSRNDSPKTERPAPPRTTTPKEEPARPAEAERPAAESTNAAPSEPRIIRPGDTGPLPNPGGNTRRISEIGMAEIIENSGNSSKYLGLHRTAPVGTLVLVRNDMNQQSIWVKIIGRLPDTSVNDKVIVKISARAFEKLSPADRRFRAEVSYLMP